ncbi:MAG TPA: nucleotidyl transferase AbiEii/AbiGii toxin family protein [bacterium]|nr:nucleotidyl transferase AbiEii/AbiGii toxin family protein [bacterium]
MKKKKANVAASVRARLLAIAKKTGKPYDEVLKLFGIERLLYRFSKSRFKRILTLKGALFFLVRDIPDRRTTLDADFQADYDNSTVKIAGMVKEICSIQAEDDGIKFDSRTINAVKIKEATEYSGVRVKLIAYMERTRIPVQIDFAFGDVIYPEAKEVKYPVLLDFTAPKLKGYPPETVMSEKFEAMVKLGDLNSRMKDFYDVWLIIRKIKPDKSEVAKAVKKTFEHRKTALPSTGKLFSGDIYDENSDRQKLWQAFLNKNGIKNAPLKLSAVAGEIEKFLNKTITI